MTLFRYITILILLLGMQPAFSQYIPVTRYTAKDGMFNDRFVCLTQDDKGFLWCGTYFGIMRYNGYAWERIEMPNELKNKVVNSITRCADKVYAGIGFRGGLFEWHRGISRKIALPENYLDVYRVVEGFDSSVYVLATKEPPNFETAVWKYKHNTFQLITRIPKIYWNINSLAVDKIGHVYIGCDNGLLIYKSGKLISHQYPGIHVSEVGIAEDGSLILSTFNKGKNDIVYSAIQQDFFVIKNSFKDLNVSIHPKANNRNGCWGTDHESLVYIRKDGGISRFQLPIPARTIIEDVFIDREQNVWIISEAGLLKVSNLNVKTFSFEEKGPTSSFILPVKEYNLVTNGFYLYKLTESGISKLNYFDQHNVSNYLYQDKKGTIWITQWGAPAGVWQVQLIGNRLVKKRYLHMYVSDVTEDASGYIWLGGASGFYIYRDNKIIQHLKVDLPTENNISIIKFCLDEQKGIIWAGTNSYGVLRIKYSVSKNFKVVFDSIKIIGASDGLKDLSIRANFFKDSLGGIWFGTRNAGLGYLKENDTNNTISIRTISEEDGIDCSRISWISYSGGYLWVSACDGIYKIKDFKVVQKYTTGDGLIENYVLHFIHDGRALWVAGSEGVSRIEFTERTIPSPRPTLSEVRVLGERDSSLYSSDKVIFKSNQNSIAFVYTANSFLDEKKVMYRYKLEGYENEWSKPTASNNVNYASLAAGTYTFKVIARNAKGTWSEQPATFSFEITLPFYKTTWFLFLITSMGIVTLFLIWDYKVKQKLKVENLRSTIARDLHDDIGSALGTINILSRTVKRRIKSDTEIEPVINKISNTAQTTLESMDEIIWTINPSKEKTIDLVLRMQNYAQPLMESEGIEFSFNSFVLDDQKLDMQARRHLYLAFKETIYNAVKHSGCSKLNVELKQDHNFIILIIADNGKGMSETDLHKNRNGLLNIKERITSLGGVFTIESHKESGTRNIIKVPI